MLKQLSRTCFFLAVLTLVSCATIPAAFVGDPDKTGFVVVEGETATAWPSSSTGAVRWGYSAIQEVTLQWVEQPMQTIRGRYRAGLTWFSDLQPGTYRVKDIRLSSGGGDASISIPDDATLEPRLTFTIGAGEMLYLGHIEIPRANYKFLRFNVIHHRDELRAWEHVYDFYARTSWEPSLLKKIETVK